MKSNQEIRDYIKTLPENLAGEEGWEGHDMEIEKVFDRPISADADGEIKLNYACPFCKDDMVFSDEHHVKEAEEDNYGECFECGYIFKLQDPEIKNKNVKVGTRVFVHA